MAGRFSDSCREAFEIARDQERLKTGSPGKYVTPARHSKGCLDGGSVSSSFLIFFYGRSEFGVLRIAQSPARGVTDVKASGAIGQGLGEKRSLLVFLTECRAQ